MHFDTLFLRFGIIILYKRLQQLVFLQVINNTHAYLQLWMKLYPRPKSHNFLLAL